MSDFVIQESDWSLYGKMNQNTERYQEKMKKVIHENLSDLVGKTWGNETTIKAVPSPSKELKEHKIVFHQNSKTHVGMDSMAKEGDIFGIRDTEFRGDATGAPEGAGTLPGEDYLEEYIDIEKIEEELFSQMELPNLDHIPQGNIESEESVWEDISSKGLKSQVHKKRTMLEVLRRNAAKGHASYEDMQESDLRFRTVKDRQVPGKRALVMMIMDTSGSMGTFEKGMARSFFYWAKRFLDTRYEQVEFEFIAHHTEANIVNEHHFFHKGESGGTICSSAFRLANDLVDEKYSDGEHTIYAYYFSDGDNLTSDNERTNRLIEELCDKIKFFGFGEVNQYARRNPFIESAKRIRKSNFRLCSISSPEGLHPCLTTFFPKEV